MLNVSIAAKRTNCCLADVLWQRLTADCKTTYAVGFLTFDINLNVIQPGAPGRDLSQVELPVSN